MKTDLRDQYATRLDAYADKIEAHELNPEDLRYKPVPVDGCGCVGQRILADMGMVDDLSNIPISTCQLMDIPARRNAGYSDLYLDVLRMTTVNDTFAERVWGDRKDTVADFRDIAQTIRQRVDE